MPRFLHALTLVHAAGAGTCLGMALGSLRSPAFRASLAQTGGSTLMVQLFGAWTSAFLAFVGTVLAALAYASWRRRPWAWPLTLGVYGVGVLGALWQVCMGIPEGWVAALVNGAVFAYAATPAVRTAYVGA